MVVGSERRDAIVALVAAGSLLLVPAQALAEHNSVGAQVEVTQADEVNVTDGTLHPDVPSGGEISKLANVYHRDTLRDHDLPVRTGPLDQSGESYAPEDGCRPVGAFDSVEAYERALPNHPSRGDPDSPADACWVGFLDTQTEYMFAGTGPGLRLFGFGIPGGHTGSDPLYAINPAEGDPDCTQGDIEEMQSDACRDPDHAAWLPTGGHTATIDTDLVETAVGGNDASDPCQGPSCTAPSLSEQFESGPGDEEAQGSGTITLPLEYTIHTFLFGQPHPANDDDTGHSFTADGDRFSQPLIGVPDQACGTEEHGTRRTAECRLLNPEDLALYDTFGEAMGFSLTDRGRLCSFTPDTSFSSRVPIPPCGPYGRQVWTFTPGSAGGLGTQAADTYPTTLPGFTHSILTFLHPSHKTGLEYPMQFSPSNLSSPYSELVFDRQDGHQDQAYGSSNEFHRGIVAVNPLIPSVGSDMWCVRPGILTDGEEIPSGPHAGLPAPGIYGDFQADAIDVDIYTNGLNEPVETLHDGDGVPVYGDAGGYHGATDGVIEPVDEVAGNPFGTAADLLDRAGNRSPYDVPQEDRRDTVLGLAADPTPIESGDPEPAAQPGTRNADPFAQEIPEGLSCNINGNLQFARSNGSLSGGLWFDPHVSQRTVTIKDPTLFNGSLPAREQDTTDGTWQVDAYTFSGPLSGVVDVNQDGQFSGCDDADLCRWRAVWDAYDPGCSPSVGSRCSGWLLDRGYDLVDDGGDDLAGVGLFAVLEVSGPTAVLTTPGWLDVTGSGVQVVNDQAPTRTSCVIMVSGGFLDLLVDHLGEIGTADTTFDGDDKQALCPQAWDDPTDTGEDQDPRDEVLVIEDAFETQRGPQDQGFSAAVSWLPLLPTPNATRDGLGIGEQELCVTAVFSTAEDRLGTGTRDTDLSIQLGANHTETYYTDCDPISSTHDEAPDDGTERDGKAHDL